MDDDLYERFRRMYKRDRIYNQIIEDLVKISYNGQRSTIRQNNEDVISTMKFGHPFRLIDSLLYNRDVDDQERFVIPYELIPEILTEVHDVQYHLGCDKMMMKLTDVYFRQKRHLIDVYMSKYHICSTNRLSNQ